MCRITEIRVVYESYGGSLNGILQRVLDILGKYGEVKSCHGGSWGNAHGCMRFDLEVAGVSHLATLQARLENVLGITHAEIGHAV